MQLVSIHDSLALESRKPLKKYKKKLKKINQLQNKYRKISLEDLKACARSYLSTFDMKNTAHVIDVFAIAREVTYRLLDKFQYDVQVLGGLACLDRNMIQMSTGSGKTITLILPVVCYGLTHKGVNVLTVNDYLSERDFNETRVVYEFFGLSCAYVNHDMAPYVKQQGFDSDVTYCTNATLGFSYLNSCLASGIGRDIKIIQRPLHMAIIDEVDEILMDDARNPLIIANGVEFKNDMLNVEHEGKYYSLFDVVKEFGKLKAVDYDDDSRHHVIGHETWDEIMSHFGLDETIFSNERLLSLFVNSLRAQFEYKRYVDYVVVDEPDPDSGSRIVLIDKATGRLSHGRTLSDNLHSFVEIKEGVFSGQSSESSIQITYQVLFNLFENIAGVTGTLGASFTEFFDIYQCGVIAIPDRLPNQLQQQTNIYLTSTYLYEDLINYVTLYANGHHPVLIGATSDIGAKLISEKLSQSGIAHRLLVSTDKNEDVVIAKAGEPGSIVVTTDIMGRGTDIHVVDTELGRGLVVFQVGTRPNSRVERQFAGRAARQGLPGRYFRLLALPELLDIGLAEHLMASLLDYYRTHKDDIMYYKGDLLMHGHSKDYQKIVKLIDEKLLGNESTFSSQRVHEFNTSSIVDLVQVSWIALLDDCRLALKTSLEGGSEDDFRLFCAKLSLEKKQQTSANIKQQLTKINEKYDLRQLQERLFAHTHHIIDVMIPRLRENAESFIKTVQLSTQVKYPVKPESLMMELLMDFIKDYQSDLLLNITID